MSARIATRSMSGPLFNLLVIAGALFLGQQVIHGGSMLRVAAAVGIMVVIGIPAIERPRSALLVLFGWLPFLGLVRRALITSAGWSALDPLLLVSSAVTLAILLSLMLSRRAILGGTPLAMLVFSFLVLAGIELFNPLQGGPLVSLTGVMFIIIPMSVFIIGRSIADEEFTNRVQLIVVITGVIAALWGLKQVYIGFTGFEQQWLKCCGYGALTINRTTRPFSTFTNSLEFGGYMAFGVIICYSRFVYATGKTRALYLAAAALMAYSGFLAGSRGLVIGTVFAVIVLTGLRARNRVAMVLIVLSLAGVAVGWAATRTAETGNDIEPGHDQLIQQQVRGLSDPTDARSSTLPGHIKRVSDGLEFAFTQHPAGLGTGAITRGGAKFGDAALEVGTELDFGNSFVATGIIGGFLYLIIVFTAYRQLYALRRRLASPIWAAVLGMAIISVGQWMNGGAYALASMIWFSLGAADRAYMDLPKRRGFADRRLGAEEAA